MTTAPSDFTCVLRITPVSLTNEREKAPVVGMVESAGCLLPSARAGPANRDTTFWFQSVQRGSLCTCGREAALRALHEHRVPFRCLNGRRQVYSSCSRAEGDLHYMIIRMLKECLCKETKISRELLHGAFSEEIGTIATIYKNSVVAVLTN
jgi:hypothetical protein